MKYCDDYAALLDLYVDGELSSDELSDVQAHLDTCPGCRAYVDDALSLRAVFPDVEGTEVPDGFAEGVMAAIRAQSAPASPVPQKRRTPLWVRSLLPLAACFAVVLLLQKDSFFSRTQKSAMDTQAPASFAETAEEYGASASSEDPTAADSGAAYSDAPAALSSNDQAPVPAEVESRAAPAGDSYNALKVSAVVELPPEAAPLLASRTAERAENGTLQYELSVEEYAALLEQLAETGVSLDALPSAEACSGTVLVAVAPAED